MAWWSRMPSLAMLGKRLIQPPVGSSNHNWPTPVGRGPSSQLGQSHLTWAMPLVPLTEAVLESRAQMLQVKLAWSSPGYWRSTVTVSSTPGEGTGQEKSWSQIPPIEHWGT